MKFKAGAYEIELSKAGLITAKSPDGTQVCVKLSNADLSTFGGGCQAIAVLNSMTEAEVVEESSVVNPASPSEAARMMRILQGEAP